MKSYISDEELEGICQHADLHHGRRGDIIFCTNESAGQLDEHGPYSNDLIHGACTATTVRYTGHVSLDADLNIDNMYQCPYRKEG